MLDWVLAGVFFFSSSLLASLTFYIDFPKWFHPPLGNAFYMAGHAAIFSGVSRLVYGKSAWKLVAIIFSASLVVHYIPDLLSSVNARILFFYPLIISLNAAAMIALWRHRKRDEGKAFLPLILVLFLFVAQLSLRGTVLLIGGEALTLFGDEFIQTSGTLAVLSFYFLITISFAVIVAWRKEVQLRQLSITDELTGWLNRKSLSTLANNAMGQAKRTRSPVGFIVLDIDFFKKINDSHGHSAGDFVIKQTCKIAKSLIREYDLAFRLGGEEFLIVTTDTTETLTTQMAERIRSSIEHHSFKYAQTPLSISISVGVAMFDGSSNDTWETVLEQADNALYASKRHGRNRVNLFQPNAEECSG
jgi:diguanylate cyclase (GGDEF)-like protein